MIKKRVLFLYNGGTLGQAPRMIGGQPVLFPPKDDKAFRKACSPILQKFTDNLDIQFELVTTKDSTNMTPADWERLVFRIKKAQDVEGYDAVAIVHGTDTLAYTATALSLALHGSEPGRSGLRIPVCITGAQNTIYSKGGDGRFNLENLFRVVDRATDEGVADVLVNFWNRVLLGSRVIKVSEKKFDAMKSPAYPDVGVIDAHGVALRTALLHKKEDASGSLDIAPKFGRGVISFELAPGIEPKLVLGFIGSGGVSALILKSLGEGNVCTEGAFSLLPVIKKITTKYKIPIFITTKFIGGSAGASKYEVGYKALQAGGIACFDHTDVAVDVKVRWLIGNNICKTHDEFKKAMQTDFAGEVTELS